MMAILYDVDVRTINEHIKKIYFELELEEDATIRNFRIVQTEGSRKVTRDTKHYNLQIIIAVGFKVRRMRRSSSVAIKIFCFSLLRSSVWKLSHPSDRKIAFDLFGL